ncbi:MAG: hypothetical protein RL434_557 [Pseudomonadota bacterium]|jgi:glycosyltransferase involved in cell wall biosynthesis
MSRVLVAFCTYNRAGRLPGLVRALRAQTCAEPFDLLAVDNNSRDETQAVLAALARESGPPLKIVSEVEAGIVPARNRALEAAATYEFLVFLDDDELPQPGFVAAAVDALSGEEADCAGGPIRVDFSHHARPRWLGDDLLGFLAAIDHGPQAFWLEDDSRPLWTSNVAYRMSFLRRHGLRFDARYNRRGESAQGSGGGEDVVMLKRLLAAGARIRYRPDMKVDHAVEPARLKRGYFLRLHHLAGMRKGLHELPSAARLLLGAPRYLYPQLVRHLLRAVLMAASFHPGWLRQAMNATHALGLIRGYRQRDSRQL